MLAFIAFSSTAFAGPFNLNVWHPAGTITQGVFPENYTFNGTLNVTPSDLSGTNFFINRTGSVGIGTATPSANLQVLGNARFGSATSAVTQRAITIRDTGDMASIELEANGTNGRNWTIFSLDDTSTETIGGAGKLAIRDVTASTTRMIIDASGNVGINTTAPSATLNVIGTVVLNGTANTLALNVNNTLYVNTTTSYVGIGTTGPGTKLHMYDGTNNAILRVETAGADKNAHLELKNDAQQWAIQTRGDVSDSLVIRDQTGSAGNVLTITTSGSVGIGTTAPNEKLHIVGNIFVNATGDTSATRSFNSSDIILQASGYNGTATFWPNVTIRNAIAGSNMTNRLAVIVNGSERVSVLSDGNVGIGTTNPQSKLDVQGEIRTYTSGDTSRYLRIYDSNDGYISKVTGILNIQTNDNDIFLTPASNKNVIINQGNVGIGTTSPNAKLEVNGTLIVNSSGNVGLWSNGTNVGIGTTSPNAKLEVNGTLIVNSSGNVGLWSNGTNVGIGTTSPGAKLDILGASSSTMRIVSAAGTIPAYLDGQAFKGIYIATPSGSGDYPGIETVDTIGTHMVFAGNTVGTLSNHDLRILTNSNDRVRITADGKVGIGTTSPKYTLEINDTTGGLSHTSVNIETNNSRVASYLQVMDSTWQYSSSLAIYGVNAPNNGLGGFPRAGLVALASAPQQLFAIGTLNNTPMVFVTNDLERMRISNAGNVGINTTSPSDAVHLKGGDQTSYRVESTGNANARYMMNNTQGSWGIMARGTTGNFDIYDYDMGGESVSIKSGMGMVGIGTVNPTENLTVNGNFSAKNGNITGSINLATSEGRIGIGTTSPNATLQIMGAANVLALNVNNTLYVNTTTSNVGIGTTDPSEKLHISGGTLRLINPITDYTAIKIRGGNIVSDKILISFISDGEGIYSQIVGTVTNVTGGGLANAGDLTFRTASGGVLSDQMTILSSGKVGIGTVSPSAKLEVNGTTTLNASSATQVPLSIVGNAAQTANLTEWYNGTAANTNNKVVSINSTGGMCFGSACNGQIFFNGTTMIMRVR